VATILVVDDEVSIRRLLRDVLEKAGHTVLLAKDGIEALEALSRNAVDLAIVDLMMPRMDGLELLRRMRSEFTDLKVVVVSAYDEIMDLAQRQKDVIAILQKPFELETVRKTIEEALG
jgi:CheY-like chemotaxis protein